MDFRKFLEADEQMMFDFMKFPEVSWKESRKLFGPVYHGTSEENRNIIDKSGFKIFIGGSRTGNISHGYEIKNYANNIPPPVHHLGYGIYFTTVKNIAKNYNFGSSKGLIEYYLDVPKLETINFGSPNTMMKWWVKNGYDMEPVKNFSDPNLEEKRVEATKNMTKVLKSKFDAVWFKGRGFTRLLDGDQICVYDAFNIYRLNKEKDREEGQLVPGDRFVIKGTNLTATMKSFRESHRDDYWSKITGDPTKYYLEIGNLKDPKGILKKTYGEALKKLVLQDKGLIQRLTENKPLEQALDDYLNYMFSGGLEYSFPSSLVGRVLKKGERVKNV